MNRIAYLLCCVEQMFVVKMRVAGRRLVVGVSKKPSDHGQGLLAHSGMAGESMAQIMDAQLAQSSATQNRLPQMLYGLHRSTVLVVPEQPWDFCMARQTVDDLACRRAEPYSARAGLAVPQEQPIARHVMPLKGEDLPVAAAGQQQQRDDRATRADREILAGAQLGKHMAKPREFLGR